jgi:hypothetical protein
VRVLGDEPRPAAPAATTNAAYSLPPSRNEIPLPQRIDLLEHETTGVKQRLDDTFTMFVALGGIATIGLVIFGFLSWHRDYQEQKNYRRERDFYEDRQRQERRDYRLERWLHERREGRRARLDEALSTQQVQSGIKESSLFDRTLDAQIANISKLGQVIDVVSKASRIRLEREEGHAKLEKMMADFQKGAEKRYQRVENEALSFQDVRAMSWPTLPEERRRKAIGALRTFENVDDFLKAEKREKYPLEYARLIHFLGIFAYYADHNVDASLDYLTAADKLFGDHNIANEFKKNRAFTKHFLGVLSKNWPLRTEPPGTSLKEARRLLSEAEDYLTMESGQFLTALTHAEVLSYRREDRGAGRKKLDEIIQRIENLQSENKSNGSQNDLLPRAYLLRGNLSCMDGKVDLACADFRKVTVLVPKNSYGWLSLALVSPSPDEAVQFWNNGLALLSKPPALDKPETVTRVLILTWGIIATHHAEKPEMLKEYHAAFENIGAGIEKTGKYTPHFFSPFSKELMSFDELKKQLDDNLTQPP